MAHFYTIHDRRFRSVEIAGLATLMALKRSPGQAADELKTQIGASEAYIVVLLRKLKQHGWVECQGGGTWTLTKR